MLLAIRLLPPPIWADALSRAARVVDANRPVGRRAAAMIILFWAALAIGAVQLLRPWLRGD